jgi:hypothetical protein
MADEQLKYRINLTVASITMHFMYISAIKNSVMTRILYTEQFIRGIHLLTQFNVDVSVNSYILINKF